MRDYRLAHLSDTVLLRDLATLVVRDRVTTAALLAHIAEVDARRLYVPAGYPCMHAYCVDELRLSEDAAYKRIQAARAARQFPSLFTALSEGRLHLAAVCLLAPNLTAENAEELIEAATYKRKSEIEELLVRRFPSGAVPTLRSIPQLAPGQVADLGAEGAPPFPERFLVQLTIRYRTSIRTIRSPGMIRSTTPIPETTSPKTV
jgi:hypothetical protein